MTTTIRPSLALAVWAVPLGLAAQTTRIEVRAGETLHRVPRHLTAACIEDVNHEIYGGLYSQLVFGESFQEPPPTPVPDGFQAFDGNWSVAQGELLGSAGDGPKLVSDFAPFADGQAGVELFFADRKPGNAGLILRVSNPGRGADRFDGYEVALDPAAQALRLGRHRRDWQLIRDVPCEVPTDRWLSLAVALRGGALEVVVDGRSVLRHDDGQAALPAGTVGLRQWQREARYRKLWVESGASRQELPFRQAAEDAARVSGMWRFVRRGTAEGGANIERRNPFLGSQSQCLFFTGGEGAVGVENQGLNRWGMHFAGGKSYQGLLWARAERATALWVSLENGDGTGALAEAPLRVEPGNWRRLEFALTPRASGSKGRLVISLRQPGAVCLGHAFLQPGPWGRFKGLPVRRDVAEALVDQGITLLRYGGSMINHPEYRWKNMTGLRDLRPPCRGTWYPCSTNGWGIPDFLSFCETAGFESVPAFNMGETPQDMADFIDYAKGPADSPWGRRRVADGHPQPYPLRYLQLGNEERIDDRYAAKFEELAKAIWAKDPAITLVVGDFVYSHPVEDPFRFTGAASGITSLAAHQRILRLAKRHDREVWFDLHVGTDGPRPDATFAGMLSFRDALAKIADGARHQVVVFEFNAGNHTQRRALANALAIQALERDGRIPIAASANCLQPDGQNDNGWDQGLLFLNPSQVWLQPPGHVTRMFSRNYLPLLVACEVTGDRDALDVTAKRSEDGTTLVLQAVNPGDEAIPAEIRLNGFVPRNATPLVTELSGPLDARNTADRPDAIVPRPRRWQPSPAEGPARHTFPPRSVTVLRWE